MLRKESWILLASALAGVSACQSASSPPPPPPQAIQGTWKTTAPGYTENYLRISGASVVFGVKGDIPHERIIKDVQHKKDASGELYTITYIEDDRSEFQLIFYHDTTAGEALVFKNQSKLRWTKQEGTS